MPLITVIIPTYNSALYISDAIESCLNQLKLRDIEILVIDDASTDNTSSIIQSYGKRVRCIKHIENKGQSAARNTGISNSDSKYIALLDSDDLMSPERLITQLKTLEQNNKIYGVGSHLEVFGNLKKRWHYPTKYNDILARIYFRNTFATSSLLIRRSLFNNELFNNDINQAEDYDLWLRVIWKYKFVNIPKYLTRYRVHSSSTSNQSTQLVAKSISMNVLVKLGVPYSILNKDKITFSNYIYILEILKQTYVINITNKFTNYIMLKYYDKTLWNVEWL